MSRILIGLIAGLYASALAQQGGPWIVRPSGPETFAVVRDLGTLPQWALPPGEIEGEAQYEQLFCEGFEFERDAHWVANLLNRSEYVRTPLNRKPPEQEPR